MGTDIRWELCRPLFAQNVTGSITYVQKSTQILSVLLDEFSQIEYDLGASAQIKKQNPTSTPGASLIPLRSHHPTLQGYTVSVFVALNLI